MLNYRCLISFLIVLTLTHALPINAVTQATQLPSHPKIQWLGAENIINPNTLLVLLELWDTPVVMNWRDNHTRFNHIEAQNRTRTHARLIEQKQQSLVRHVQQLGGEAAYRLQRTSNGIAAHIPLDKLEEIANDSNIWRIRPIIPKHLDHATSVGLIGAPQLWQSSNNLQGQNIKIGVIDTGIDYIHSMFGGSASASEYQRNDPRSITDISAFPSAKIVGGFDFAGDLYDANNISSFFPIPDQDPMDCQGHGTHVAGTVGGYGVRADGKTYTGPWNATQVPTNTLHISPGVAPLAQLYALRVFGCQGSTALTPWALEWATDPNGDYDFSDRLDVVNLSLGTPFGGLGQDVDVDITNNAAMTGLIIVASAGNAGDTFMNVGSPSSADWAISVGSSVDALAITDAFRINAPASLAGLRPANELDFGFRLTTPITGTVRAPSATQTLGCNPFNAENQQTLKGQIALIDRGTCSVKTKVLHAQLAGARGVLVIDNQPGYPSSINNDPTITTTITIPSMMIMQADGAQLKANQQSANVTLNNAYNASLKNTDTSKIDTISSFSSRGPRRLDGLLKPDVVAPGDTIFSAEHGSGTRGTSFSGTSMAAPHVAGSMALLRQLHPTWSLEELKALLMNTASVQARVSGQTGAAYSPSRQGSGRIDLVQAAQSQIIAYNADQAGVVSLSFGVPEVLGQASYLRNLRIVNKGNQPATLDLTVDTIVESKGVSVTVEPQQITVAAGTSTHVAVHMSIDATQLDHTLDPATSNTQNGSARQFLNEHAGHIVLSNSQQQIHVPFYVAPRPVSALGVSQNKYQLPLNQQQITLQFQGQSTQNPNYPSRAWIMELHESSTNDQGTSGHQNAADLQYIGISSNVTDTLRSNSLIYFAVSAYTPWSTPIEYHTQFVISIDVNHDNFEDYVVSNSSLATARGDTNATDQPVAAVYNAARNYELVNTISINQIATTAGNSPYFSSAMILPVTASSIGLNSNRPSFRYQIRTFNREYTNVADVSDVHQFNAAAPSIRTSNGPVLHASNGLTNTITINRGNWLANNTKGILVFYEQNAAAHQAEHILIDVAYRQSWLPIIRR